MVRIPAPGRFEIRVVDGAANPYLAFAGIIAAGLDGIAQKIDPGPVNRDNLYEVPEEELLTRESGSCRAPSQKRSTPYLRILSSEVRLEVRTPKSI